MEKLKYFQKFIQIDIYYELFIHALHDRFKHSNVEQKTKHFI